MNQQCCHMIYLIYTAKYIKYILFQTWTDTMAFSFNLASGCLIECFQERFIFLMNLDLKKPLMDIPLLHLYTQCSATCFHLFPGLFLSWERSVFSNKCWGVFSHLKKKVKIGVSKFFSCLCRFVILPYITIRYLPAHSGKLTSVFLISADWAPFCSLWSQAGIFQSSN